MTRRLKQSTVNSIVSTALHLPEGGWRTKAELVRMIDPGGQSEGVPGQVSLAFGTLKREGVDIEEGVDPVTKAAQFRVRLALPAPVADDVTGEEEPGDDGAAYTETIALSTAALARVAELIDNPPAPTAALRALMGPPASDSEHHALLAIEPSDGPPCAPPNSPAHPAAPEGAIAPAEPADGTQGPATAPPDPASRCAVCGTRFDRHMPSSSNRDLHAFQSKPRGRPVRAPVPPPVGAAPARLPRTRQRRTPGPVIDVDGGRVEWARAADPDVDELPTAGKQRAILDGMACKVEEAITAPAIYAFHVDCGRHGDLDGTFLATSAEIHHAIGLRIHFDEPWGKHSGVDVTLCAEHFTRKSDDAAEIETFQRLDLRSGEDPIAMIKDLRSDGVLAEIEAKRAPAYESPVTPAPIPDRRGCRPPTCHADAIHVPSRVVRFVPPLCPQHRAWLEGAGGTVAGEADRAALTAPIASPSTPPDLLAFRRSYSPSGPLVPCKHEGPRTRGPEGELGGHIVFLGSDIVAPYGVGVVIYLPLEEEIDVEAMRDEIVAAVRA